MKPATRLWNWMLSQLASAKTMGSWPAARADAGQAAAMRSAAKPVVRSVRIRIPLRDLGARTDQPSAPSRRRGIMLAASGREKTTRGAEGLGRRHADRVPGWETQDSPLLPTGLADGLGCGLPYLLPEDSPQKGGSPASPRAGNAAPDPSGRPHRARACLGVDHSLPSPPRFAPGDEAAAGQARAGERGWPRPFVVQPEHPRENR